MSAMTAMDSKMIVSLKRTSIACPSQWEGWLGDQRSIYIRFRHNEFSVHIGPVGGNIADAVSAPAWLELDLSSAQWDGFIEIDDVLAGTGLSLAPGLAER